MFGSDTVFYILLFKFLSWFDVIPLVMFIFHIVMMFLNYFYVYFFQWDEELEEKVAQEYKVMLLDALEARWRAETESACYYSSSYTSWLSYGTSFMTNIVENLQVSCLLY